MKDNSYYYSNVIGDEGNTPIHLAVLNGSIEDLKRWMSISDVNSRNKYFETPLHLAVAKGDSAKVLVLTNSDHVYLNAQNLNGDTALHYAAKLELDEIIRILQLSRADSLVRNNNGITAQQIMISNWRKKTDALLAQEREDEVIEEGLKYQIYDAKQVFVAGLPEGRKSWRDSIDAERSESPESSVDSAEEAIGF